MGQDAAQPEGLRHQEDGDEDKDGDEEDAGDSDSAGDAEDREALSASAIAGACYLPGQAVWALLSGQIYRLFEPAIHLSESKQKTSDTATSMSCKAC